MKQRIKEWYNYCGVEARVGGVEDAEPSITLTNSRYVCLPFLDKAGVLMELDGVYYYSLIVHDYNSEALGHYTVRRTEGGYYLSGTRNSFPLKEVTDDVMDNELNPIPLERRLMREEVMSRYNGMEPFKLPPIGNLRWGD